MPAGLVRRGKQRLGAWELGFCSQIHHQVGGWRRPLLLSMSSSLSCTPGSTLVTPVPLSSHCLGRRSVCVK